MRVPHYLVKTPHGYTFRLVIPKPLRPVMGLKVIKRTLKTHDLTTARVRALILVQSFMAGGGMSGRDGGKSLNEWISTVEENTGGGASQRDFTLKHTPGGGFEIQTDGTDRDNAAALDAIGRIQGAFQPIRAATAAPARVITAQKALDRWLVELKGSTKPKTLVIKRTAVEDFVRFVGAGKLVNEITRPDLADYYQHCRASGMATPTIYNRQSYLKGFFKYLIGGGFYTGENPAPGHVEYGSREQKTRLKLGFVAFTPEQVKDLYAPTALLKLSPAGRWAAVIGLYTGMRASEVGQLLGADISRDKGVWCIQVTDAGEHQSTKNDSSNRLVPVHPDLLALGFAEAFGKLGPMDRVFSGTIGGAINGAGNWLSKAFTTYARDVAEANGWPPTPGKRGFHSLRSTIIQTMQDAGVDAELRAKVAGHTLDPEHFTRYSKDLTSKKLLDAALVPVNYGLDLTALKDLLASGKQRVRKQRISSKP